MGINPGIFPGDIYMKIRFAAVIQITGSDPAQEAICL
jgi:hypothetical protein